MGKLKSNLEDLLKPLGFEHVTNNIYRHKDCGMIEIDTVSDIVPAIVRYGMNKKVRQIKEALYINN